MTKEPAGTGEGLGYRSYLLRLWRERGSASIHWRASLQDPHSGERMGFAHLDELVAFLREQTGLASPAERLAKGEDAPKTDSTAEEGEAK